MQLTFRSTLMVIGTIFLTGSLSATIIGPVTPINSVEGSVFSGTVASFTDSPTDPISNYSAIVNWGDGTTSAGSVTSGVGGSFNVGANHTYAEDGIYDYAVTVNDSDGSSGTGFGTATIADAVLSLISHPAFAFTAGVPFNPVLGSFGDANPFAPAGDFSATIDWGDGSSSLGTITGSPSAFSVSGAHTYVTPANFTILTTVNDEGGSTLQFQTSAVALPEPGTLMLALIGFVFLAGAASLRRNKRIP